VDEHVLLLNEIPVQSPYSVNLMFDKVEALSQNWKRFAYVVDLTAAKRPDAETRAVLKERSMHVSTRVAHVALVVGNNPIMRAMARLFAYTMGFTSVGIHAARAEAIEEARRVVGR